MHFQGIQNPSKLLTSHQNKRNFKLQQLWPDDVIKVYTSHYVHKTPTKSQNSWFVFIHSNENQKDSQEFKTTYRYQRTLTIHYVWLMSTNQANRLHLYSFNCPTKLRYCLFLDIQTVVHKWKRYVQIQRLQKWYTIYDTPYESLGLGQARLHNLVMIFE